MSKLVAVLKKLAMEMIFNDETKAKIIASLNKKVNIPLISEDTEKELMEGLYEAMEEALKDAIEEKSGE
tara:strand:+ start:237 stop:443 length:207 start_codon:yes stop_codon:yes gene_type:complete